MANTIEIKVGLDTKQADAQLIGFQRRFKGAIDPAITSAASLRSAMAGATAAFTAFAAAGIAAGAVLKKFAEISIDAALQINKQVNVLKALTGSAEAAEKRFASLFALAQKTPGLTTNLALTLDAQLRVFDVAQKTIDKLLPVIGRLNAISPLVDPAQFINNLTQLISGNFDREDLKELARQSPIAGLLIKDIFDVNNPTNAEAIRAAAKRLGITTVERLAEELVKAAATNSALKNATESLAGQFEKLEDRITVALAPIGEELLKTILPAFKELVEILERDLPKITELLRNNRDELLAIASAFVSVASAVGMLIGEFNKLDQKFGIIRAVSLLITAFVSPQSVLLMKDAFDRADARTAAERGKPGVLLPGGIRVTMPPDTGGVTDLDPKVIPEDIKRAILRAQGIKTAGLSDSEVAKLLGGGGKNALTGGAGGKAKRPLDLDKMFFAKSREFDIREREQAVRERIRTIEKAQEESVDELVKGFREDAAQFAKQRETRRQLTADLAAKEAEILLSTSRRGLARSGRFIDAAVSRGQLTPGEAELLGQAANAEFANQLREVLAIKEKILAVNDPLLEDLRDEIALFDQLGAVISDSERFMRGFNSQIETSGDAFERFGQNVSRAFTNIRDIFGSLKNAVLQFFNDILGQGLQNLMRQVLGPIFGGGGGGGVGNFFSNLFRTPSFAGGGGLAAPPSVSLGGIGKLFGGGGGGTSGATGIFANGQFAAGLSGRGSFLGGLGSSLAVAAPLLGLTFGSALGGQSTAGKILGGIGGALAGSTSSLLGLGSIAGFAGVAAAPLLLVGSFFLGRAKQRGQDEQVAGQMLLAAQEQIRQLKAGIASDSIDGGQARAIFDRDILGQFIAGIRQLKTSSVRESRLTNQAADLRKLYDNLIPSEITAQLQRRQNVITHSKLIPEFATGAAHVRGGLAILHPGEMVLNLQQQANIARMSSPAIFQAAGVPGIQQNANFDRGGIMPSRSSEQSDIVIEKLIVGISAEDVFVAGGSGARGRRVIIKQTEFAMRKGEL